MCESGGIAPPFLTSVLDGGEWTASHLCRFTSGETAPSNHGIGSWVGRRAGLDALKRTIFHYRELNPGRIAQLIIVKILKDLNFISLTLDPSTERE
jgi:hypothetical protein